MHPSKQTSNSSVSKWAPLATEEGSQPIGRMIPDEHVVIKVSSSSAIEHNTTAFGYVSLFSTREYNTWQVVREQSLHFQHFYSAFLFLASFD